jgi:hypothetical protein
MSKPMIYAGVGSKKTPTPILKIMWELGKALARDGTILRSGHAEGADMAFETGFIDAGGRPEIYLPWASYNEHLRANAVPKGVYRPIQETGCMDEALEIASTYHPNWGACSKGARLLHARNVFIMLGYTLSVPVKCVVCWTPEGKVRGGTGQALRMAQKLDIQIINMGNAYDLAWVQDELAKNTR